MNCPSCDFQSAEQTAFCIRCGFSLTRRAAWLTSTRRTLSWVLRRSLAGLATGMVGWWVIPAAGRVAGGSLEQTGHLLLTGGLGGLFLGSVEGMMEESVLKTLRGAFGGLVGGMIGGSLAALTLAKMGPSAGMQAVILTWSAAGLFIGLASAWPERKTQRFVAGALAGLFGGAMGGWLGYEMYASVMDVPHSNVWAVKRFIEGITGAILGAVFWFVLGLIEKLFIFKRLSVRNISYKECDVCGHDNILKAWYCAACGLVLQVSAPPEKLEAPRRQALARLVSALQFLSHLSVLTSLIVAVLAGIFLGVLNPFLGMFGLLVTALTGYILFAFFNSVADLLSPLL